MSRRLIGLPAWLPVGLVAVTVASLWALIDDDSNWAVVSTALATILLALFTAQLYSAAVAQLRASTRPLLVEVKPYAAPPADLGGHFDADKGRHTYNIEFQDGVRVEDWDGRRPYVSAEPGTPLRVSLVLRNVGEGLALIDERQIAFAATEALSVAHCRVRYPRLPPDESTRISVIAAGSRSLDRTAPVIVDIPYTDLSGTHRGIAHVQLDYLRTRARTKDDQGRAWIVTNIAYELL